jgi:hypothetical protein
MNGLRIRWAVGTLILIASIICFTLVREHLPRSWVLRSGDWRFSNSGFVYSLKFKVDGTVVVRQDDSFLHRGTYELLRGDTVVVHAGDPLPWEQVGSLQFSADGSSLISTTRSLGTIRYEHH